jgi:aryl-alcohol dehydrogenase-like predicted oxidoreductase
MFDIQEVPSETPLETVELGKTGLNVSPLGLGTWAWGDRMMWQYGQGYGEDDLVQAFRASLSAGVNFFDTAEIYGEGKSEKYLGQFVRQTHRHLVTVATKFWPWPWRYRRANLLAALRASLERLQMDYIDLYQIHWPVPGASIESRMEALADAVELGLTRTVGVSNFNLAQTRRAYAALASRGVPLASNQVEYSLLQRKIERNGLMDYCRARRITIIAYSPLAKGVATTKYTPENPPPGLRGMNYNRKYLARVAPLMGLLRELAETHSKTPAQVALNWVICKGAIPIPGAKNARQATDNAGALGWRLSEAEVAALDKISDQVTAQD